jgi:hypothetical protein
MRNIIPIIFVAAIVLTGCKSPVKAGKTKPAGTTPVATATIGAKVMVNTNAVATTATAAAATNTAVATAACCDSPAPAPVTVGPNTPEQTLSENYRLGNLATAFLVVLTVAAVRRP